MALGIETTYRVKLTLLQEMLGTVPIGELTDQAIYEDYILAAAPNPEAARDELETLPTWDVVGAEETGLAPEAAAEIAENGAERGWTGFHMRETDTGIYRPIIYDYMLKGHLKDACGYLRRVKGKAGTLSAQVRAYKKKINGGVFIEPRRISLQLPEGALLGANIRPLRASTPQGDRVALARSLTVPAGTTLEARVIVLGAKVISQALLEEWLAYGRYQGLGQWRNAGYGRFAYEIEALCG